ncbi:Rha family transcriptional regulator [Photorhabdus sp. HUG-39]|uniref:Rha family transcriptional regulator n=1 Tax=Photorhabdus kayaii TaxID=230088 RepID=A0ABX0B3T1_9GAMM|nr:MULTISPECIES: Rha family transcriptional regulator [Photorhabdus]MCC8375605.1 Rha family transcriptional regulator [Photorhabdus bodei]NDL14319.1 Rha family transcriptional regulator [Photorhabdus kayaii]NDL27802.1 Rha family transcriptional regulator [Photorhabdus kayaii]RAX06682.1 Rha family transcriptional regulator [Photorhabdus sp. HUG-39]
MTQLTVKTHSSVTEAPTMTSLEMVDYINAERKAKAEAEGLAFPCKKYRKLRHSDFTKKVPKVLGEGYAKNFSHPIKNQQNGEIYSGYKFPKRESCLMAMSYSYELQAQVFDHMTELEVKSGFGFTIQQLQHMLVLAKRASDEDSSDAGRRLRKRQDDLVTLNKAERLINDIGQMALGLVGGGAKEVAHEPRTIY